MKTKLFLSAAFLTLMMCFSLQSYAQAAKDWNDTMLVFNQPLEFLTGEELSKQILGSNGLQFKPGATLNTISVSKAKKLILPRAVKTSSRPIVLRHNGTCYQFSCDPACGTCQLVWLDRNGDGKVQPRRELRCVNAKGKVGKVSVQKVRCQ